MRAIEAAVTAALAAPAEVRPPIFAGSVDLEVDLLRPVMTERAALIPGVERRGPLTLGFQVADYPAAYDLIDIFAVLASSG